MKVFGRHSDSGIVLIPVIVSAVLIAGIVIANQARSLRASATYSQLIQQGRNEFVRNRVYEAARVSAARMMIAETGAAVGEQDQAVLQTHAVDGQGWIATLMDVDRMPDIYLSSPSRLREAGIQIDPAWDVRERLQRTESEGLRYATLEQTMARFGLQPAGAERVTQRAISGSRTAAQRTRLIRLDIAPVLVAPQP